MKIFVKVKAGAKEDKLTVPESIQANLWPEDKEIEWYTVQVKALPKQGKANDSVIKILAEHFGVTQSRIRLIRGATSKQKAFEIKD